MSSTAPSIPAEPPLLRADAGGVCTLTLNRPRQFNALSEALIGDLQAALDDVAADEAVRVVVIAGAGRGFCAGHDLKELHARRDQAWYEDLFNRSGRMMRSIVGLPKPVIARVHGLATAAGCQLVGTCDLAVASREARFAVSGIEQGLFCSTPSVALSRNVSRKRAFRMLITGEFIDADTAADYGLVNEAVAPYDLDGAIERLCDSIIAKSPVAVATGKRMFYRQIERDLEGAYRYAAEVMACNMMAEDVVEGFEAFFEKRPPVWRGR